MDAPLSLSSRVTIRDLAKRLGLSHAAVSMALRDHPEIASKTRERVRAEAARCGYRPEPMLSALAAYRQMKKPPVYHGTIAWINYKITHNNQLANALFKQYFEGACERANLLGFQIEEFYIDDQKMPSERASEILLARGVQGVLVAPQLRENTHMHLRWDWFSCVTFGFSLKEPQLHLVSSTQYRSGMAVTRKLHALGYERVGFVGGTAFDQRTDRNFTAGYRVALMDVPKSRHVPLYLVDDTKPETHSPEMLREWVRRWRVDAIVCLWWMHRLVSEAGLRIPEDVAVAQLGYQSEHPRFAGMDEQGVRIGAAAVDCVVGMIHRGERGVPESAHRLMIEGKWMDGPSAPPKAHGKVRSRKRGQLPVVAG